MITKWKLFNFKSIRNETELEFGPLTIFAGSNSSGKSTVLQSMLLISQTLASRIGSRSVILNGPLTKLGQFDDIKSFGSEARQILIGWEVQPKSSPVRYMGPRTPRQVNCEISFEAEASGPQRDLLQLQPRLFGYDLRCVNRKENIDIQNRMTVRVAQITPEQPEKVRRLEVQEPESDILKSSLDYEVELDESSIKELQRNLASAEPVGCNFRHFIPYRLSVRYDQAEKIATQFASELPRYFNYFTIKAALDEQPDNQEFLEYINRFTDLDVEWSERVLDVISRFIKEKQNELTQALSKRSKRNLDQITRFFFESSKSDLPEAGKQALLSQIPKEYKLDSINLPENISAANRYIETLFTSAMKYLGPLRDEPKSLYPLTTSVDPTDVGLRGELTAAVYDLHKERPIRYIPTEQFKNASVIQEPLLRTLESAAQDWLVYMGVAESVQTIDKGKLGHELKVTTSASDAPQDLTHVGVGVSQVLPILVMCLLAEVDTTLIIEQPELHLHPKVQTLLADFFLSMAMLGKQCIIETHSEYIINRLRFRAAAAQDETISSLMKIYFVEKKEGASVFRDVVVNKYGAITDWPEGFFDQSQSEAEEILRAATMKRKQEKGGK